MASFPSTTGSVHASVEYGGLDTWWLLSQFTGNPTQGSQKRSLRAVTPVVVLQSFPSGQCRTSTEFGLGDTVTQSGPQLAVLSTGYPQTGKSHGAVVLPVVASFPLATTFMSSVETGHLTCLHMILHGQLRGEPQYGFHKAWLHNVYPVVADNHFHPVYGLGLPRNIYPSLPGVVVSAQRAITHCIQVTRGEFSSLAYTIFSQLWCFNHFHWVVLGGRQ